MCLFLGAFAKLWKSTIDFVMSVCPSVCLSVRPSVRPSVRMKQLGSHWADFQNILYLSISRIFVEKNRVSLESDNNGYFTCRLTYISDKISLDYPYDDVSDQNFWENQNMHLCSMFFFNRAVWENVEKYGTARQATDDNITQYTRFACWKTKARIQTHTQNMY